MRAQHLFLFVLLSLLVSFPVIASDWVYVVTKYVSFAFDLYVDEQSIKGDAISRGFWVKRVFNKEEIAPISGKYFVQTREDWEIDCKNDTYKIYRISFYTKDNKPVNHLSRHPDAEKISPDSIEEAVAKYVCSLKPTK